MKGDFTRDTFDPGKHFSRVLMQQGRVQLDADWNEQTAILLYYLRTLAKDILGPHAGPADATGFEIITKNTDQLDAKLAVIEPDETLRKALKDAIAQGNALIGPGRYYVDGVLVESERAILYSEQLGYPFNDATTLEALKNWNSGFLFTSTCGNGKSHMWRTIVFAKWPGRAGYVQPCASGLAAEGFACAPRMPSSSTAPRSRVCSRVRLLRSSERAPGWTSRPPSCA